MDLGMSSVPADALEGLELRAQGDHDKVPTIQVRLSSHTSPRLVEGSPSGHLSHDRRGSAGFRGAKTAWNITGLWTRSTPTGT